MQWYFVNQDPENNILLLDENESHHCIRVMRMQEGDALAAVDGKGNFYRCVIQQANYSSCQLLVKEHIPEYNALPYSLHIAIAPTKNIERLEWFLEKATEIGLSEITPLLCAHSERKYIKPERLIRIIESAVKQSKKAFVPKFNPLTRFNALVGNSANAVKLIAHCSHEKSIHLKHAIEGSKDIIVLIGPEGDFSTEEVLLANNRGFQSVSLGNARLRTETAGVYVASIVAGELHGY